MHSPASHPARPRRIAGFTLIELLTVIAIIGVLVAISIVAIGKVRNQALSVTTLSRTRNIGTGYLLAVADNKQKLLVKAPDKDGVEGGLSTSALQERIAPYLAIPGEGQVRLVNTVWWDAHAERNGDRTPGGPENHLFYADAAYPGGPLRYKLKGWQVNPYIRTPTADGVGYLYLIQIRNPSRTALLVSRRTDSTEASWNVWADGRPYSPDNPKSFGAKRLSFYFDGHIGSEIISGANYNASGSFPTK